MGGTIVFDMLIAYGGSRDRTPNAENMQAAIEHALGKVDFTKGRRLQLGESVEEPIKFVDVEKLEGEASINVGGVMSTYSDTFQVTIGGFGPLLQRISNLVRTFDFLKSCADKLRADGRTSVAFSNNAYTAARVEGKGWVSDADGNPIPNVDPSEDGSTFLYRPEIEYAQFDATVLPPPSPPPLSPPPQICMDTCGNAGDGVCQDGGWKAYGSMCEFGTDCSDCGSRLLLDPPPSPPVFPPPPPPTPLPPGVGVEATSDSVAAQDAGPGLAIGLALGGCLLVAMLAAAIFVWHRKRRMQPPPSSASTAAPQQVEVTVTQPEKV